MTTPQPMKHAPSQQGKTPQQSQYGTAGTPGASASTPYSNLHVFSPHGPKSSPQHFKKSPATSGFLMAHSQPGLAAMNFDSPSAAAYLAGFDTSSLVDNIGLAAISMRLTGSEEREKRLDEVLRILNEKKGVVSEEGLERLTKRVGFDCLWEDNPGIRTFVIAGATVALEIGMRNHVVQTVSLHFPVSKDSVTRWSSKAEAIFAENLKLLPDQHPWTKSLDRFATNLEHLAILDKLSVVDKEDGKPHLVTHDALAGLYESLDKLHTWDIKKIRENTEMSQKDDEHIAIVAMCERNGRPVMHERGQIGMCLNYWSDRRLYVPRSQEAKERHKSRKVWGILVGCAPRDPLFPAPVRVSNEWIADEIELLAGDGIQEPMVNWQQPPNCILPEDDGAAHDDNGLMALTGPKMPEVMFMATFDPPITLPYSVWVEMHQVTGAPVAEPAPYIPTFDSLIFPPGQGYNAAEPRMITTTKRVKAFTKHKEPTRKTHENQLFVHRPVYGQTLTHLPFSHPSQLIAMFPTIRQYAFLRDLLDKAFGQDEEVSAELGEDGKDGSTRMVTARSVEFHNWIPQANKAELRKANNSATEGTSSDDVPLKIDVTLNAYPQPNPRLQIMFPFAGRPAQFTIDIERNGVVQIESCNIVDDDGRMIDKKGNVDDGATPNPLWTKKSLGRRLMVLEDIGLWCEWIRVQMGP